MMQELIKNDREENLQKYRDKKNQILRKYQNPEQIN